MSMGKTGSTAKAAQSSSAIEGTKTTQSLWNIEDNIKTQLESMTPALTQFAIHAVVNIIVVWVVWKIGSHVMWFNSIPRNLLKSIYPPGYEFLIAVLKENDKSKVCTKKYRRRRWRKRRKGRI